MIRVSFWQHGGNVVALIADLSLEPMLGQQACELNMSKMIVEEVHEY